MGVHSFLDHLAEVKCLFSRNSPATLETNFKYGTENAEKHFGLRRCKEQKRIQLTAQQTVARKPCQRQEQTLKCL